MTTEEKLDHAIGQITTAGIRANEQLVISSLCKAFIEYACSQLDQEAMQMRNAWVSFEDAFDNLSPVRQRIIANIIGDLSLRRALAAENPHGFSVRRDMQTGVILNTSNWEVADANYAEHGEWETRVPNGCKFTLRSPDAALRFTRELECDLTRRIYYWAGKYPRRAETADTVAEARLSKPIARREGRRYPKRAAWLKAQMKDRDLTASRLYACGGPDRKTTTKILDAKPVRDDALDHLALGLSNAPNSQPVLRADIPDD